MRKEVFILLAASALLPVSANAESSHGHDDHHGQVSDQVIAKQRAELAKNTKGKGFGPQSPRDIDANEGRNNILFATAPAYEEMNLCNIHFHKNAEHKGGEFTEYAGNGDGHGYLSGYKYTGKLSAAELKPASACSSEVHLAR